MIKIAIMNNREAYEFLASKGSVREATTDFLQCFDLEEEKFHCIRRKFAELKKDRVLYRKKNDISTWEEMLFFDNCIQPEKKRLSSEGEIWVIAKSKEVRKPLLELTTKGQRIRLEPLISFMNTIA